VSNKVMMPIFIPDMSDASKKIVEARRKKKLDEASNTIDQAQTRTNAMTRKLKSVEALSELRTQDLLPGAPADDESPAAAPDEASAATE
jgi:DNA anti-recombination protein RmuC